jgi:uncharacterized protein (DUF1800 family)
MTEKEHKVSDTCPWSPYEPDAKSPWNLRRVVHLHRRAGFGATWEEIRRDLKDGPKASIDRILSGMARAAVAKEFEQTAAALAENAVASGDAARLKAWWLYRMLSGPDPLAERLALLWHNHFATSNDKVRSLAAMRRQNELFRKHGRGRFPDLLKAVIYDPALLVWLDAPSNKKGAANENLARELMELFTMGVGNYSEKDVKEAARALTGWTVDKDKFREDAERHDDDEKEILGKKGRWRGDDLVGLVLEHPATAKRLSWRLCGLFLGEGARGSRATDTLADGLREHKLDIGWAVETILRSQAFFAEQNLGGRVLGPVEYALGAVRALELSDPPPSTLLLADWVARLGQDLFYPPNVGGWPEGRSWIGTGTMIGRANYGAALVDGDLSRRPAPLDGEGLAKRHNRGGDRDALVAFYGELLVGYPPGPDWRGRLMAALGDGALTPETVRRVVALLLASPEAQQA